MTAGSEAVVVDPLVLVVVLVLLPPPDPRVRTTPNTTATMITAATITAGQNHFDFVTRARI
jgi:hypothetical protein